MEHLIRQYNGWETAQASDILAWMSEEITIPNPNARRNGSQLQLLIGIDAANSFAAVLTPTNPLMIGSLNSPEGIDFSLQPVRDKIIQLSDAVPQFKTICDQLLALGTLTYTRWSQNSGPGQLLELPTVEEISTTIENMKIIDAKTLVRQWRDEVLLPLVDENINAGKTVEEIKALISA